MLLLKVLNNFGSFLPVGTLIFNRGRWGRLTHVLMLLVVLGRLLHFHSRYRLGMADAHVGAWATSLHSLRDFGRLGPGLLYNNLGVILDLHRDLVLCLLLNSEFLDVQFFLVFFRHFGSWNTDVYVLKSILELGLLLTIDQRNPDRHVEFDTLIINLVKKHKVVPAHVLFSLLWLQTVVG